MGTRGVGAAVRQLIFIGGGRLVYKGGWKSPRSRERDTN